MTLSPAMRERAPLVLPGVSAGDDASATPTFVAATVPGVAVPAVTLPGARPSLPAAAPAGDDVRETSATGPGDVLAREDDGLAGGGSGVAARPGEPPIGPALGAPGTTVVDLPTAPAAPEGAPRRFTLRVVGVDRTADQIRVRVSIDPGPNAPASTVTIALKPSAASTKEGQAVKVSLDVVTGEADSDPKLRVRIAVVEDTTGGETTHTEGGDSGSSNVLDISVPVTPGDDDDDEETPADPGPSEPATSELLLDLGGTTSSEGSAVAPAAPAEEGTEAPTVTVEVSVTPDPEPVPEPAPAPPEPAATEPPAVPASDTPEDGSAAETSTEPVASSVPVTTDPAPEPVETPAPPAEAPQDTQPAAPAPAPEPAPAPAPAPRAARACSRARGTAGRARRTRAAARRAQRRATGAGHAGAGPCRAPRAVDATRRARTRVSAPWARRR
ncbi:hypothetical protein LRS13_23875 [Svornostia abyssi]|uniref:Uncharacterized protein n=1 Tax=Svornostia abyssi TaxID=2898438 RepID=A0ABY5PGD2_9ACTN|nr:hypothetical protein LRS13_23875 [Parviterribacteraceae bacterium J379]